MSIHSLESVDSDNLPEETDVVIIGGGIVGVSTALFLAKQGLRVSVCEKGVIGGEQSGRNWGWVRQMGRDSDEMPLAIKSMELWRNFEQDYGVDVSYRETGITYLCQSDAEIKEAEGWAADGERYQIDQKLLHHEEVREFLPGLGPGFRTALHTSTDGRAEPAIATPAIARIARRFGATIHANCAVRGIETTNGRVSSVVTEKGEIKCTSAVVAGGAWSRLFLGSIGVRFPQLKVLNTAARVEGVSGVPNMPIGGNGFAYRPRHDGGYSIALRGKSLAPITPDSFCFFVDFMPVMANSWREFKLCVNAQSLREVKMPRKWQLDQVSPFEECRILDPKPHEKYNQRALENLKKAFPAFESARVTHQWGGMIDATPDFMPVIDSISEYPGLYLSSGYSGHGFGIGPGAGLLTSQLVAGEAPCVDPTPYRFDRYQRGGA